MVLHLVHRALDHRGHERVLTRDLTGQLGGEAVEIVPGHHVVDETEVVSLGRGDERAEMKRSKPRRPCERALWKEQQGFLRADALRRHRGFLHAGLGVLTADELRAQSPKKSAGEELRREFDLRDEDRLSALCLPLGEVEEVKDPVHLEALMKSVKVSFKRLVELAPHLSNEHLIMAFNVYMTARKNVQPLAAPAATAA